MKIKAHDFPEVYQWLGINLSKLGCVMLDLEPIENINLVKGTMEGKYYAKNLERFWIDGWVFDEPHITLLYGLLEEAKNYAPHIEKVLEGWKLDEIEISDISYFDSPYPDELYYCIVAHIKVTDELLEGHERLSMLPHLKTFPGYKAHSTICYLNKNQGEEYRDKLIEQYKLLWVGKKMKVKSINLGGNK